MKFIDLRSDTVTWPTQEMRQAMAQAEVGDDVYGDDPTVNRLEKMAAERLGKEAALFVPSGTMGNQLAIFTHVQRGDEVITAEDNHIVMHEAGAAAIIAGAQLRCLRSVKGRVDLHDIESTIRRSGEAPKTGLICMENAHSSGVVHDLYYMRQVRDIADRHQVPIHLDGARIFNAAAWLKVDASTIAKYSDSVMFCLSKGLCAPVGSILAGTYDFVERARQKRRIMGGGMRQAGILAAAGIIALDKMSLRVHEDHEMAVQLASLLEQIPGVRVRMEDVHINMVFIQFQRPVNTDELMRKLKSDGIIANPPNNGVMRLVTHYYTDPEMVKKTADVLSKALA